LEGENYIFEKININVSEIKPYGFQNIIDLTVQIGLEATRDNKKCPSLCVFMLG
jgi:hypothetical protein